MHDHPYDSRYDSPSNCQSDCQSDPELRSNQAPSLESTVQAHAKGRYDNKVRLSSDVLAKAELIAQEWGLKNARAAVEAVFRKYSDRYLQEHNGSDRNAITLAAANTLRAVPPLLELRPTCEALDALEDLLRM